MKIFTVVNDNYYCPSVIKKSKINLKKITIKYVKNNEFEKYTTPTSRVKILESSDLNV